VQVFGDRWKDRAAKPNWKTDHAQFVHKAYGKFGIRSLEDQYGKKKLVTESTAPPRKKPRIVSRCAVLWEPLDHTAAYRLEVLGDSLLIISWCLGLWKAGFQIYANKVCQMQALIEKMVICHGLSSRSKAGEMFRHVYRELNAEADAVASRAENAGTIVTDSPPPRLLRLMFDGSVTTSRASGGWILYGADDIVVDDEAEWRVLAWQSFIFPTKVSITAAELEACFAGVTFLHAYLQGPEFARHHFSQWHPYNFALVPELQLSERIDFSVKFLAFCSVALAPSVGNCAFPQANCCYWIAI